MSINDFLYFTMEQMIEMMSQTGQGVAGKVELKNNDDEDGDEGEEGEEEKPDTKIVAEGMIFPNLCHEIIKGLEEAKGRHGLPKDPSLRQKVQGQVDTLSNEPMQLRIGPEIVEKLRFALPDEMYDESNKGLINWFHKLLYQIPEQEFLEIISKEEIVSDRVWTLRYELFDEISISNIDFSEDRAYHGAIDIKRSMITKNALNSLIQTIVENHTQIKEGTYHIIPKDTHTEYELLNYIACKKGKSPYIERATSKTPINHVLKTSKRSELEKFWSLSKYGEIPSFKELFDEI